MFSSESSPVILLVVNKKITKMMVMVMVRKTMTEIGNFSGPE